MTGPIEHFILGLEETLPYPRRVRDEVVAEARDHLLSHAARWRERGLASEEAEMRAVDEFGTIEDFVARFEAEGGPITALSSPPRSFGSGVGAYVGLLVGILAWDVSDDPLLPLVTTLIGAAAGALGKVRHNLGPLVGLAMGAVLGSQAIGHYLVFHARSLFGATPTWDEAELYIASTLIGSCAGTALGFIPRIRQDPAPILWATIGGLGGHAVARLWLEDAPTLTGMTTLAVGLILGTWIGFLAIARRYAWIPLGTMIGAAFSYPLLFLVSRTSVYSYVSPGTLLALSGVVGGLGGLAAARHSRSFLQKSSERR